MTEHDAACDWLRVGRAAMSIARAEHGCPYTREHLAGQNLFQDAADIGPRLAAVLGNVCIALVGEGLELVSPAIQSAFRFGPILLDAAVGNRLRAADQDWPVNGNDGSQFDQIADVHETFAVIVIQPRRGVTFQPRAALHLPWADLFCPFGAVKVRRE